MTIPADIWLSTDTPPRREGSAALFLDRDGVLVKEVNYLKNKEDVALESGAAEIIAWGERKALALVCVTNQSGIARGLVSWDEFRDIEAEITQQLARKGAALDLTLACPFHPDFTADYGPDLDRWRKPGPAMIEHAARLMGLDLGTSWLIGDKAADIEAARRAGLAGGIIVMTGYGRTDREKALALAADPFEVHAASDLHEALTFLDTRF